MTQHIVNMIVTAACVRQGAGVVPPSVILVGTKLDLVEVGCRREVTEQEARTKADTLGALYTGHSLILLPNFSKLMDSVAIT